MLALRLRFAMVLAGMLATVCSAAAQPGQDPSVEVQAVYREVVILAVAEFDAQRFAEARALFLRAHELWPSARTLRTLGMTSFELGNYPRALAELSAARDDTRRPLPDDQRSKLLALIEKTVSFVGRYHVQLRPADAELEVAGSVHTERELVLALGEHVMLAHAHGYLTLRHVLTVQGREDQALLLTLEPLRVAMPAPSHREAYVTLGTGAAGLIMSGVFSALALRDKHTLGGDVCPQQECPASRASDVEQMQRHANVATAGLVIGLVGVAVGTLFWFAHRPERSMARVSNTATGVRASF